MKGASFGNIFDEATAIPISMKTAAVMPKGVPPPLAGSGYPLQFAKPLMRFSEFRFYP
jgi:hypothetical protein